MGQVIEREGTKMSDDKVFAENMATGFTIATLSIAFALNHMDEYAHMVEVLTRDGALTTGDSREPFPMPGDGNGEPPTAEALTHDLMAALALFRGLAAVATGEAVEANRAEIDALENMLRD